MHDQLGLIWVEGESEPCVVKHGDVISSGVRPGVAATQQRSECLDRGVEICEQRVEPKTGAEAHAGGFKSEIGSVLAAFTVDSLLSLL
jgi:hypothetical protein